MKKLTLFNVFSLVIILVLLTIGLSGCSKESTPTLQFTPIPLTPDATATPTLIPAKIALFDPNGLSGDAIASMLSNFASTNSLGFETWTSLPGSMEGVKIVVVYGVLDNLAELSGTAPQTQFVVVSQSVTPSANISVVSTNPIHQAFLAGYLAAMTSDDWRAGALIVDDANLGLADAFINGGKYLCGRCIPVYTPMLSYPQVYTLSGQSDAASWSAQATTLLTETAANSVFIDRAGDILEVLDQFSGAILYGNNSASVNLSRYTAILGADVLPALEQALPDLLVSNGGKTITAPIRILVNNNPEIISPAKIALFDQVAQALAEDLIVPLSVP